MNWYDTQTLRSLEPRYISTVDSGNLAGGSSSLSNACSELVSPQSPDVVRAGLGDGLSVLGETIHAIADGVLRNALEQKAAGMVHSNT